MSDLEEKILFEETEHSVLITINRPQVYNAMDRDTKLGLVEAISKANTSAYRKKSTIILTGKGKAFCSGQDLKDRSMQKSGGEPVDLGHTLATEWNPLVKSIRQSKKIVIGAINGVCAGAGFSVALACDLLVSRPLVKFMGGFAKIGLCPDAGSTFTLARALGRQRALAFSVLGTPLTAEELHQYGLITAIGEDEMEEAKKMAAILQQLPPLALEKIKENFHSALERSFEQSLEVEIEAQRFLGRTKDYQEGVAAFLEKRPAHFQGQ